MAKKLLALPLSGRQNIIAWMETFRNDGVRQSVMDFFDVGNNYTTNARVEAFNKKVSNKKGRIRYLGNIRSS